MPSVRLRLAAWNLGVLGLVVALVVGTAIVSEVRTTDSAINQDLRRGAERAAPRVEHIAHEAAEHHEDDDDDVIPGDPSEMLVFARLRGDSRTLANRRNTPPGLPDEGAFAAALIGKERLSELKIGDATVRVLTIPVTHYGRIVGAVQVAKSTSEARRALASTVTTLAATGLLGLLLAVSGSVFLAGRAMRPITNALERQRRFVADASHELRTPVAVLRARAETIARDSNELSPETRDELAKLRSDAGELASLLGELLDLARLDAGQAALRSEPIAVGELAQDIVEQMTSLAHERGIELTARGAETFARGDLARMRQVLRVLIDNALAHTERGGRVLVEASHAGARALVSVTDNGEGIAPEHLPHIFERFYRADAARSKGGAGLGLAIASELVRLMNGELRVESERGKRTTFVVELPAPEA